MRVVAIALLVLIGSVGAADAQTTMPSTQPSTAPTSQPAPLPADQVLNRMLRPQGNGGGPAPLQPLPNLPTVDAKTGAAAVAPGAEQITLLREGSYVVDRTGRLSNGADGQSWEFTFEADGRAMKDPPVVVLPNLKLMQMEQALKGSNKDLRFRITGMLTEYNGRNYVLIEKVVVPPDSTQQF